MLGILWCKSQFAKALPGQARLDLARLGRVGFGMVLHGPATVADGSTEPERALCCSLRRVVMEWRVAFRQGVEGQDTVGPGVVNSCRRQHRMLRLPLLLSLEGRQGKVRWGRAGQGQVRLLLQTAALRTSVLSAALFGE